nr:ribonuclease H-like domain-containing protein [Tanacetum cinerariifolium]
MTDYSLWEVIKNGNKVLTKTVGTVEQTYEPTSIKEKLDRLQKLISQLEIQGSSSISQNLQNVAFVSSNSINSTSSTNEADNTAYGVSTALTEEDLEQIDLDDLEEMNLHWDMAMLTIRARRFIKRTSKNLDINGQKISFDMSKVECFNCYKNGHFARECRAPKTQENRGRKYGRKNVPVENLIENALIAQDELRGSVKTVESKVESVDVKNKSVYSTVETKLVRKNNFSPPIIEDWNSDDESKVEIKPKVEVKIIRPCLEKLKFVKTAREKVKKVETPKQHKHYPRGNVGSMIIQLQP